MKRIFQALFRAVCLLTVLWFTAGCSTSFRTIPRTASYGLTDTDGTQLGKTFLPQIAQHPEDSGLRPLPSGVDALAARLTLVDQAQRGIDVQYYIWDPDDTGKLLAERLIAAADRGVRVRMLLDDFGTTIDDQKLLALASHPNIEVRLFNPIALRGNDVLGMLFNYSKSTRRMHNKSFNADNQVAIVGGRNIGDAYFQAGTGLEMADLDVLAVGTVVHEVSDQFDLYWNCPAAIPISGVADQQRPPDAPPASGTHLIEHAKMMWDSPYGHELAESPLVHEIQSGDVKFFWGKAELLFDDPAKITELSNDPKVRLMPKIRVLTDGLQKELLIVSPYFVPGQKGIEFFHKLHERGIRVVVLTNSLASTDALAAYAGYSRYREQLLDEGVELYELKPTAAFRQARGSGGDADIHGGSHGSSQASLHAKTFNFDRQSIFVGSLNLDPRSAHLNTEVGVVFDNPEMASGFAQRLETLLPQNAWRVEAVPDKFLFFKTVHLNWVTQENGVTMRLTTEPGQTAWRGFLTGLIQILPVESQL